MQLSHKHRVTLFILLAVFIFAGTVFADGFTAFTGQVNADNINVRVDATVNSTLVCTLSKDQLVEIVSEAYDWYRIHLPKTAPSYIKKNLVKCINNTPDKCFNARVTGNSVNIRLSPSESSWILGNVDESTVVNIIQDEGLWYKIEPVHQSYGWVNKKFINKEIVVLEKAASDNESQCADIKPSTPPASEQIVVEGIVSPYGVVLWRKATHKLITGNGQVYFLKGNRKGLNSLNYHKVKVTGKIISPKNSMNPIIGVDIVEVLN
jgi:uncharacterized protein YgiM (DUF1202 family)